MLLESTGITRQAHLDPGVHRRRQNEVARRREQLNLADCFRVTAPSVNDLFWQEALLQTWL